MSSETEVESEESAEALAPGLVAKIAAERHYEVVSVSDLDRDGQRAYYTYKAIKKAGAGRFVATYDGEIYSYEDGHWEGNPTGTQRLRELSQVALEDYHSNGTLDELKEQVRANDAIPREWLGCNPGLIPASNGLVDVERARDEPYEALRDPTPEDYVLSPLPVGYNPAADCPNWSAFVEEVAEDGMADALQEYVGYCLLVNQWRFDRVLLLVGSGSNGKSTFLNIITELLGTDNVTGFSIGDLAHNEYHVAQMFGAVANIDADVTGGIGHGGMFKKLTGGDRKISARHPYGRPFDFAPKTKHLYSANQVPQTEVDDNAFFRRWLVVEFPNEYTDPNKPGPDKDPDLEGNLMLELPGILNWAIEGLHRLLENEQFTNEGDTEEKRERWVSWGDTVDKFIDQCIETGTEEKHTTSDVYDRYTTFCQTVLEQSPESQRTVTGKLKKLEDVQYSSNFRFDGAKRRGFKGFSFAWTAPGADDTPENIGQTRLPDGDEDWTPQDDAIKLVRETIIELQDDDSDRDGALVEDVLEQCADDVGGPDRVEHIIDHVLAESRKIYRPDSETVRTI